MFIPVKRRKATINTAATLTVMGFTEDELNNINCVRIGVETDDVRFDDTSDTLDSTTGTLLKKDAVYFIDIPDPAKFSLIKVTNNATVQVTVGRFDQTVGL